METINNFESLYKLDGKLKLNSLLSNDFLADTILINKSSNKEFKGHKAILASSCEFLYFSLKDKDINTLEKRDEKLVFYVPERNISKFYQSDEDQAIELILKFIYNNQKFKKIRDDLNEKNIYTVLSLAHCFRISKLNKKLTNLILEKFLNSKTAVKILFEGLIFENEKLVSEAINLIQKDFNTITNNVDDYNTILDLPYELLFKFVNDNNLNLDSEKQICDLTSNSFTIF